jgi:hypothetical protein
LKRIINYQIKNYFFVADVVAPVVVSTGGFVDEQLTMPKNNINNTRVR